jgi:hypothetical protein
MHWLAGCSGLWRDEDADHSDQRIWDTAEGVLGIALQM